MKTKPLQIQYTYSDLDKVYQVLTSTDKELHTFFHKHIENEYNGDKSLMLHYFDIAEIGKFLIDKLKKGDTSKFELFFEKTEEILNHGDADAQNLIIVGLFEGIQNIGGKEINYHSSFNKWLKPESKLMWDYLIDFWEGTDWRNSKK
ncbi:DUF7674 family protein [Lacibacter sp.]|uniref:DUF7674 family protein n=1 Tax=Lacibacter sp. TaxID=1915409 RepID=UPI002B4AADA2|nr:hypothetical protein [Lacibacter sp.]HLP38222.1 hypothetical protein [Lacibacter sp.]